MLDIVVNMSRFVSQFAIILRGNDGEGGGNGGDQGCGEGEEGGAREGGGRRERVRVVEDRWGRVMVGIFEIFGVINRIFGTAKALRRGGEATERKVNTAGGGGDGGSTSK